MADRFDTQYHEAVARLGDRLKGKTEARTKLEEKPPEMPVAPILMPNGKPETKVATCPRCARQLVVTSWVVQRLPVVVNGQSTLRDHKVPAGRHCPGCKTTELDFINRGTDLYAGSKLIEDIKRYHIRG